MNRKLLAVPVLAATIALAVSGCAAEASTPAGSDASSGRIAVVASTDVWGDIAATVGGDHVTVTSIIDSPDKDPHEYTADAQDRLAVSKAQVAIVNGGGYDDFMSSLLKVSANSSRDTLNAVEISGKATHADGVLNEHVWYDLPTAQKVAQRLSDAYAKLDPAHASAYTKNAAAFTAKVDGLEQREAALKTSYAGEKVTITEPVPLYMLDSIGLVDATPPALSEAIENDGDVAPAVLKKTLDLYTDHSVALLVFNSQTAGPLTKAIRTAADDAGVPAVAVTETLPQGADYISWMTENLDAISTALSR